MGRHKEWRKIAKKMRRKRIRSAAAAERDEAEKQRLDKISSTPYYKAWLAEQEALEEFREQEERAASILAHEKWVYRETLAQERWAAKQKMLKEEEAKRKEQEAVIKREWEREQEKERLEKEAREEEEKRKKLQYERLMEQMDSFIDGSGAKPEGLYTSFETNPGREPCPFFSKVGACRFRDSCTRNHLRPGISSVILIPGFYSHFSLEIGVQGEYDTDINLEFDQSERFRHFKEFFDDVIPELEKFGPIFQFRVCSNTDPHLRGNVYIAYKSERAAAAAYKALNGRYYAGRMLSAEFVNIPSWKNAICGLQYRGTCPKGSKCNFLHVFRNPNNLYSSWDKPIQEPRENRRSPVRDDWRWTPSPPFVSDREDDDRSSQRAKRRRDSVRRDGSERDYRKTGERSRRDRSLESRNRADRRRSRDGRSTPELSSDRRGTPKYKRDHSRGRRGTSDRDHSRYSADTPSHRRDHHEDRRETSSHRRGHSRDGQRTRSTQDESRVRQRTPSEGDHSRDRQRTPSEQDHSRDRHRTPSERDHSRDRLRTPSERDHSRDRLRTPSERDHSRDRHRTPSERDHSRSRKDSSGEEGEMHETRHQRSTSVSSHRKETNRERR